MWSFHVNSDNSHEMSLLKKKNQNFVCCSHDLCFMDKHVYLLKNYTVYGTCPSISHCPKQCIVMDLFFFLCMGMLFYHLSLSQENLSNCQEKFLSTDLLSPS